MNLYTEYIILNAGLDRAQARIKITREISIISDTQNTPPESEELKSLLMKVKEESEKAGLKLSIQEMKIMASGPITSYQIDGKNGNSYRFYFLGLQNHCRGDCSHDMLSPLIPRAESIFEVTPVSAIVPPFTSPSTVSGTATDAP